MQTDDRELEDGEIPDNDKCLNLYEREQSLICDTTQIKPPKRNKLKIPTKRERSIEYWNKRGNKTSFLCFLFVLKNSDRLPKLPKDLKKLIYHYVANFFSFHIQPNYLCKTFELVNHVHIILPENSLICNI